MGVVTGGGGGVEVGVVKLGAGGGGGAVTLGVAGVARITNFNPSV